MVEIVFLCGPSEVGKSDVAQLLKVHLGFRHVDIDQHHGFHANGLRQEWYRFSTRLDPEPLTTVLYARIVEEGCVGAVLSLPSTRVLTRPQIEAAEGVGIRTVVLWGLQEFCRDGRRRRESKEGRTLDEARYDKSNRAAFDSYGGSEYSDVRLEVFRPDGSRHSDDEIIAIIQERLANRALEPSAPTKA